MKLKFLKKLTRFFLLMIPFFIIDFGIRYVLNPVWMSPVKYNVVPILFDIFYIGLFVSVCWCILPQKIGGKVYLALAIIFGVWFTVNYVCFKILGRFLWIEDIFLAGEASNYINSAITYIDYKLVLLLLIYIVSIIIAYIFSESINIKGNERKIIPMLICIMGLLGVDGFMNYNINKDMVVGAWEVWQKPTLVYDKFSESNKSLAIAGFYQYTFKSIYKLMTNSQETLVDEQLVVDYFNNKKVEDNEMTGILKDKNIIFVLMESMDDWIINEKYTPTIKYMMDNGINFTNHYMPNVGMGYTFNAEFAANTGYYCPTTETSMSIFTKNSFPYSLGNVLKSVGYETRSFHFNTKDFYNRASMHKRLGYDEYISFMKYLSIEKCVQDSESVKNDKIYNMMINTNGNQKFVDFIITYSPHLPYNIEDNKLKGAKENYPELINENMSEELNNLYLLAHDTDEFFRILLERLENDGILEETVIIAFADHYAYGVQDKEVLKELSKESGSEILEKVPFFIYSPQLEDIEVDKVTSTIDIMPTIANMLGIEERRYYIGEDAFNKEYKGLVYFPDGRWYDGNIFYKQEVLGEYTQEESEYIMEINKHINELKNINDYVILTDYFAKHIKK